MTHDGTVGPGKRRLKKFFASLALAVVLLILLLSLLPYLIPPRPLPGDRHELAFPESVFTRVNGVELHYRLWDSDVAEPENILLVHGFGGSTFSWRHTAPALVEAGFRVVAVDLPGFGLSERKTGLDHTQQGRAELLWTLLDELVPGGSWRLVGHSMGGGTVTAMSLQRPEKVGGLVLAGGSLVLDRVPDPKTLLRYPPARRWVEVLSTRFLRNEANITRLLESAYGRPVAPAELDGYHAPLNVAGTETVLAELRLWAEDWITDGIGRLDRPVLCIWGEADSWVPLEQGERLAGLLPRAELAVIAGEGHCPMETAPEQFNALLLEFLRQSGEF